MNRRIVTLAAVALGALALAACGQKEGAADKAGEAGVLNLYTARHYDADQKLYDLFAQKTGIDVNRIEGKPDELIARMKAEGANSPADVFIAAGRGRPVARPGRGAAPGDKLGHAEPVHPRQPARAGRSMVRLLAPGPRGRL